MLLLSLLLFLGGATSDVTEVMDALLVNGSVRAAAAERVAKIAEAAVAPSAAAGKNGLE